MTKIKVSKQLANDLRKYRFEDKEDLTIEELIDQLKNQTNKDNFSEAVEQTLAMDIIGMNSDKLDTIKDDEVLVRMLNRLNISDKQLKFIVRKIKADKEIIESRMTDSEIKEVNKELRSSKWSRISSSRTINKWRDCLLRYYSWFWRLQRN